MKLSILIPAIPERLHKLSLLYKELQFQASGYEDVEIISVLDNKKMSIGKKREACKSLARGEYIAFIDDDDWAYRIYVDQIMKGIESGADVITFKQTCIVNNSAFVVTFGLGNENEELKENESGGYYDIKRKPFHVCAFRRELVKDIEFPSVGYGEDWDWCKRVLENVKTEYHIDEILHEYKYDSEISKAPVESNEVWRNPNE